MWMNIGRRMFLERSVVREGFRLVCYPRNGPVYRCDTRAATGATLGAGTG